MDRAAYEKIIIKDSDFPIVVLENDKDVPGHRHQLCTPHWHEQLELHFVLEGELEIWINQSQHILQSGDLIVINGNDSHCSYCSGRLKERILIFKLEDLSKNLSHVVPAFQQIIRQDAHIGDLMAAFDREYMNQAVGDDVECKAVLLHLAVYLARNYTLSPDSGLEYRKRAQLQQRFLPVQAYIEVHYAEPIDSETLANILYLSKDRFNHLFKECMGIPLRKYINDIRLHTAMGWLEKGLCSPAEAAYQAGFTDYNHFGRLFRQTFGCTPSQACPQK